MDFITLFLIISMLTGIYVVIGGILKVFKTLGAWWSK